MKNITLQLFIVIVRILVSYLVCLLFTTEPNILLWSITAKVWFLVISIILIQQDY